MAWIYQYIRADGVDVDMGEVRDGSEVPFEDEGKCKEARDQYSEFGAMCSEPIKVSDDYVLQKHDEGHY